MKKYFSKTYWLISAFLGLLTLVFSLLFTISFVQNSLYGGLFVGMFFTSLGVLFLLFFGIFNS
jgi:hypothetical protein